MVSTTHLTYEHFKTLPAQLMMLTHTTTDKNLDPQNSITVISTSTSSGSWMRKRDLTTSDRGAPIRGTPDVGHDEGPEPQVAQKRLQKAATKQQAAAVKTS
ncbi:hypothetical protein FRB93_011330 [Tulasnella sp. JGI-2019a]|nr:hypothetical protein FRB93_011330 [Tulasnella sp. JGI-2019a]